MHTPINELDAKTAKSLQPEELQQPLDSQPGGLDQVEAWRLATFGSNRLPEVRESLRKKLFHYSWGRYRG